MKTLTWLSAVVVFCSSQCAIAAPEIVASVDSPDKRLNVELLLDEGRLSYQVSRLGRLVIAPSRLGFVLQGAGKIERNLALVSAQQSSFEQRWEQPWGEQHWIDNRYQALSAQIAETSGAKRQFSVQFRVYDDGLGFRYEFPKQAAMSELKIVKELTEFAVAEAGNAWWIPAGEWNRYEYLYQKTALSEVGQVHTPLTMRTNSGLFLSIHEAALVNYASMWLRRVEGTTLRSELSPAASGYVQRELPFHTPWRTIQIGDRAGDLVESMLILNLNEPNKLGDVSWVKPSKYVGIWWSLHLDTQSWGSGAKHGATTANTKKMIDFAAEHGFRGVLVEGWNPGWDGDWFANGWNFDFRKAAPDFDLSELGAYAKAKGVHLVGHHETACAVSHYERQMRDAFAMYARHGVDSVKTGYVCDAGQIERQDVADGPVLREWHDGQWMSEHHLRVLQAAAREHISINAHEPIKDTGLRRTYPNWLAREGARGMEYNAWGNPPNPPEHEANLIFTRMLSGPMDFTPGVLSLKGRGGQPFQSTLAKQLAQYVVLYSPIQMAADLPEHYQQYMDAFQFIKDVPVDWEQSRVLNGEIGDYATIVRQDRHSDDWYLGAVTDERGRVLPIRLDFLAPDRRYQAQIYRDADDADFKTNPSAYVIEQRYVKAGEAMNLRLAPGGGMAIRFKTLP